MSIVHLLVSVDKISHKSREKVLMKLSVIIKIAGGLRETEINLIATSMLRENSES